MGNVQFVQLDIIQKEEYQFVYSVLNISGHLKDHHIVKNLQNIVPQAVRLITSVRNVYLDIIVLEINVCHVRLEHTCLRSNCLPVQYVQR